MPQAQALSPAAPAEEMSTNATASVHARKATGVNVDSASSKRSSRRGSLRLRRRSSGLVAAARASFYRSRGQSGASVETLRGNTGADFEGFATVHRGDDGGVLELFDLTSLLTCCGKSNDGLYFLLIKGYHCFVFKDESAKSPKFAIELMNRRAVIQQSHNGVIPRMPHPGAGRDATYTTINLETSLGDVEYKITFANMEDGLAAKFCTAVDMASNEASTEQVRKRLGHEQLLNKHASVRYANVVGTAKAKEQPEVPVGTGEVLAGMPTPGY